MNILDYLPVGSENAVPSGKLASRCGLSRRELAMEIHDLRERGHIICANTGHPAGYYIAANRQEAARFLRSMQSRQREIEKAIKATRKYCMEQNWTLEE